MSGPEADHSETSLASARTVTTLLNVARRYERQQERELNFRIPNMTKARAAILLYLAEHHDCSKQVQLAEALDLRPESIVGVLDGLERLAGPKESAPTTTAACGR